MVVLENITSAYIREKLISFKKVPLQGIRDEARLTCLVSQFMDSIKRVQIVTGIRDTVYQSVGYTPDAFHPLKVSAYHKQRGNVDEACWLAFLAVHFGEDEKNTGWNLLRNVYCALGDTPHWNWDKTSNDISGFRQWLQANKEILQSNGRFGNHRKYESLLDEHTGESIASYINWYGSLPYNIEQSDIHPHLMFEYLYKSMDAVWRFGRTAKFDYLCLLGKMELAKIEPGHPYLQDATGPLLGAKLLFGNKSTKVLNGCLWELGKHLNLYFAHQICEDAICNFNKSPDDFISF